MKRLLSTILVVLFTLNITAQVWNTDTKMSPWLHVKYSQEMQEVKKNGGPKRVQGRIVRNYILALVKNTDDEVSLQIIESSQIDHKNAQQEAIFQASTHFNPVDLVCGCWNYQGEAFHLTDYVDANTGFVSNKSKDGRELKALELPGLWNGAMADWITIFVEVPIRDVVSND